MIYIKRILWLLGYPIMWLLASVLFIVAFVFIGFVYIKNGDIQCFDVCLEWVIKFIDWYNNIELKEN